MSYPNIRTNPILSVVAAAAILFAAASRTGAQATAPAAPAASPSQAAATSAPQDAIVLDPGQTIISFQLPGDLHTTHGSFRLTSGRITIDPATGAAGGKIVIDAASSTTDNSLRDAEMHDRVLESGTYPEITFLPHSVHATRTQSGLVTATVSGDLSIHGGTHPITVNVSGTVFGDVLKCSSSFVIPYQDWGMRNPSWLMFRVAGTVDVNFNTVGQITWAAPQQAGSAQKKIPPQ